jgi:release factor glutamine methyltransferase
MNMASVEKDISQQLRGIYPEGEANSISDWVLEYITGKRRAERIASRKEGLEKEEQDILDGILTRLMKQEPVQYVLKQAWFCGLKFYVDNRVLIPRPETEELVEWVISNCKFPIDQLTILDVGSGSGCIPVALKRRIRKADVWSCDKSKEALTVAIKNAEALGTTVHFIELDFLDHNQWQHLPDVNVIVSNPPYIPQHEGSQLAPNVREHEPHMALFVPDNDALVFYSAIAAFGKLKLKKEGSIYAEIHEDKAKEVLQVFCAQGYQCEIKKDMQGKERMIKAFI